MLRWTLAVLLLVGPLASAQATTTVTPNEVVTTLYFHLINIHDFPINTQVPNPAFNDQAHFGAASSTLTCVSDAAGGQNIGGIDQEYHTFYGYSSPSFVEYDRTYGNRVPYTHTERVLGANVSLDQAAGATIHWFLTTSTEQPLGPTNTANNVPLVVPNVVVKATMLVGGGISLEDKAYNEGTVAMDGQTEPVTLAAGQALRADGQPSSQVHSQSISGQSVYDFAVPMAIRIDRLPAGVFSNRTESAGGFKLRMDTYIDNPLCNNPSTTGRIMPNLVSIYSSAQLRPRLELHNRDPLFAPTGSARTENLNGTVLLRWSVGSPWGSYDVDIGNATIQIVGPSNATSLQLASSIRRTHEMYHVGEPWQAVWQWNTTKDHPKGGVYVAILRVPNLQHTAVAETRISFMIGDGRAAPALPVPIALLALAFLVAVLRRNGALPPAP